MLRKLLLFLSILLIILTLVWSLPQCSRTARPIDRKVGNTPAAAPSPVPISGTNSAEQTGQDTSQPAAPIANTLQEETILAEIPEPTPSPTTAAEAIVTEPPAKSATKEAEATSENDKTHSTDNDSINTTQPSDDQPAPPLLGATEDIPQSKPSFGTTEGTTSIPKQNNTEGASTNPATVAAQPSMTSLADTAFKPISPTTDSARQPSTTIVLDGVNFASNSDALMEGSETVLDNVITSLEKTPSIRLEIAGYTDDRGDPLYNRILSRRRAEAVMIYLVNHGIDARRLTAAGYGSDDPIADNRSEQGRQTNRRVELHIR